MSTATMKSKRQTDERSALDRQMTRAKSILRQLRDTLEDLEDRRDLARARTKNAGKTGTRWETVKKEFGLED